MATTNLTIRTDKVIKEQGIPFELELEIPNEVTAAAIDEGRKLMNDSTAPRYSDMSELKAALEV